ALAAAVALEEAMMAESAMKVAAAARTDGELALELEKVFLEDAIESAELLAEKVDALAATFAKNQAILSAEAEKATAVTDGHHDGAVAKNPAGIAPVRRPQLQSAVCRPPAGNGELRYNAVRLAVDSTFFGGLHVAIHIR
ncbi:hypothetical protein STAS_11181, partial [Striga asiatica]